MSTTPTRLPAAERRQAIVDAALRVFGAGSYSGATTAEIAREARVSEPILYRHFPSKRALYLACVDEAWERLRAKTEELVVRERDPAAWPLCVPRAVHSLKQAGVLPSQLWIQSLGEAAEDAEIRRHLRRHLREVHAYFAGLIGRSQAAGGVPADRDAHAEAWIQLGIGLLRSVQDGLGGLLTAEDAAAIAEQRRRWLTGSG